ncbi:MAG: AAA family ATPase [Candidatus Eremiobacterota bacterium]
MSASKNNLKEEREGLSKDFLNFVEEKGMSRSDAARDMGISDATLSLWLSNKYDGSVAKINEAVKNFLEREKERSRNTVVDIKFVAIGPAKRFMEIARVCHLDRALGVIYGESGSGKTWSAREYVRKHYDAILVEVDPNKWSGRVLLKKIHRKLNMDGKGNADEMMLEIIARLEGTGRFIIIDEAENLDPSVLDLARRIHDHARIGMLLVGTPRLVHNLRGREGGLDQVCKRSSASYWAESLKIQDTEAIVKSCIAEASAGLCEAFHQESGGNVRVLSMLILRSIRFAETDRVPVDPEYVRMAKKFITI